VLTGSIILALTADERVRTVSFTDDSLEGNREGQKQGGTNRGTDRALRSIL